MQPENLQSIYLLHSHSDDQRARTPLSSVLACSMNDVAASSLIDWHHRIGSSSFAEADLTDAILHDLISVNSETPIQISMQTR